MATATVTLTKAQADALKARHEGTLEAICTEICVGVADCYLEQAPQVRAEKIRKKFMLAQETERVAVETALKDAPEEEAKAEPLPK